MDYSLTEHAKQVLERPLQKGPDKEDMTLQHYLGKIPEYENRVLRVILNIKTEPNRIITAYFDRSMKGKL